MTVQQFLLILRARYKLAIAILLATVTVTLVVSLLLPKQYTATSAVVIDVKSLDPVAGVVLPGLAAPGYMATQVDIINSDRVAQRVVKLLRMDENLVIREQWMEATDGKGDKMVWLAGLLKGKLTAKHSRESNVITIEFSATDPGFVAAVANAFAQAYIDINLELKVEPARQYAAWFEGQTRLMRDNLEKGQQALSRYQQQTGIIATDERLDYETAKLNDISTQITVVQAQTSDSSSKRISASNSETLVEVMNNSLVNSLKLDIARLEGKLQESNVNFGRNHPQTQRTESELTSLRAKLASETRQITSSIGTSYKVGKQKEKELLEALEAQKKHVLEFTKQRDEISVLKRDVEAAQRAFEGVSMRSMQTRLESQSVQTNIAMLNRASLPTEPSNPKILLNVSISIFLGTLLGVSIVLLSALVNRRVHSAEDLVEAVDLPVLAIISSIMPQRTLREMLHGFLRHKVRRQALAQAAS